MRELQILKDRTDWLGERRKRIGGSEAASIVGLNPWLSNVELWRIKTGRAKREDVSGSPYVQYGTKAEEHLRELFRLDFPQYKVSYKENNLWTNKKYPFAHASLDGWLEDEDGRFGILEIKTTTIQNPSQKLKWENRIPDNYFCQVLWYMAILEADFAVLKAQLKWERDGNVFEVTKHYKMERADFESDIDYLMDEGGKFALAILKDEEPPLVLPRI